MSRAALVAAKSWIAAQGHPTRDEFAEETADTRFLYFNPDSRRWISEFLNRSTT